MYRCTDKPPGSIEKFTWDLTPLLVGAEIVNSYSVAVEAGTVAKDSDSRSGAVVTAFISGGAIGETARVRCRASLNSGRQLDVSFYFRVDDLYTLIDAKDPDDIDDITLAAARLMNSGATISTFTAFSDQGGCVIGGTVTTTTTGAVRVSGGTENADAEVRLRITTSDLETLDWTAKFEVKAT